MCLVFKISAYPFGQVKTKMYLPESPFFRKSLAGASGLVLMSVPVRTSNIIEQATVQGKNEKIATIRQHYNNCLQFQQYLPL